MDILHIKMRVLKQKDVKSFREKYNPKIDPITRQKIQNPVLDHDHDLGFCRGVLDRDTNQFLGKVESAYKRFLKHKGNINILKRAKIIVNGLVQGVGFRYVVMRNADQLGLNGFTQNLYTGEVLTEVEGREVLIMELIRQLKVGPSKSHVVNCFVEWMEYKNEFTRFEVRY